MFFPSPAMWQSLASTSSPGGGVTSVNGDTGPAVALDTDDIPEGSTNKYFTGVVVDGTTITGDGTPGDPLVAAGGSLPSSTRGQIFQNQGSGVVATESIEDSDGDVAIDWSTVGQVKISAQLVVGANTNGRPAKVVIETEASDPFTTESATARTFWDAFNNGGTTGAVDFVGQFGFYSDDFFGSGEPPEIIVNGPVTNGYKFRIGGGGDRNENGSTYFDHLGKLFFGDQTRPSITPLADAALIVGKELLEQKLIEFFQINSTTPQVLVTFNNSIDSRAGGIDFLEDNSGVSAGTRVSGLNLGVVDDANIGFYVLDQVMQKIGSDGTFFLDGADTVNLHINTQGRLSFSSSIIFQTTVGSAGSASALPALPREYLQVTTPSGTGVIPVYDQV